VSDAVLSTVSNAARLLKEFRSREASIGVSELARRLGLGKSGVHRLLTTLVAEGLLERDPQTGGYRLGIVMFELGEAVKVHLDLHAAAGPVLAQLREQTGESSQVGVLDGVEVVYVDRLESAHSLRLFTETGRRVPAHCTSSGKVLLAHQSEPEREAFLARPLPRLTPHTIVEPDALRDELTTVRARGVGGGRRRAGDRRGEPRRPDPRRARRRRRGDQHRCAGRPLRRGAPAPPRARAGRGGRGDQQAARLEPGVGGAQP
jgi:DNA-binding IclR family transcriptional regulator